MDVKKKAPAPAGADYRKGEITMAAFFTVCGLAVIAASIIPSRVEGRVARPAAHGNEMHYDFR